MSRHLCHARLCTIPVPPKMFMCIKHWRLVPKELQNQLWASYSIGQEERKDPSELYLEIAHDCIEAVERAESI